MAAPAQKQENMIFGNAEKKTETSVSDAPVIKDFSGDVPLSIEERLAFRSPARRMQETLGREFAAVEDQPWSARRTVAFVALTCGAFWTCVYFVVAAAIS